MMILLYAFVLGVGLFLFYILAPLFQKNAGVLPAESGETGGLALRKENILAAINDLEYDFRMKKISEPDYLQLKEKLTQEAIGIIKKLEPVKESPKKNALSVAGKKQGKLRS